MERSRWITLFAALALTGAALPACGSGGTQNPDGGGDDAGGDGGLFVFCAPTHPEDVSACRPAATDYLPRQNMSKDDAWPACISDDNRFHLIGMSTPASAARAMAFDSMGRRLWWNANPPSADDFFAARNDYSLPQGIGSRVERRQDIHYPEVPGDNKFACQNMGVPEQYPDRCAGPAKLLPIVNGAFQAGLAGTKPRVQAARLEATLLWFFYLSTVSEVWTCGFDDIEDCDAAWGYFSGAQPREAPTGMGAYFQRMGLETYQRGFDGILAERCWRDLDRSTVATMPDVYQRASHQLDVAELRGLALIARDRFAQLACLTGEMRDAQLEFLKILVGFLDRESRVRDAAKADVLKAEIDKASADLVDVTAAQAALDALYPCP